MYWNKGPAFLSNKQLDIGTIIETHKPHILGLGEANFRHDHDLLDVQQPDYNLHLDSCIDNPDLDVNEAAELLVSKMSIVLDKMAPVRTI